MKTRPTVTRTLLKKAFSEAANTLTVFLKDDRNLDAIERFTDLAVSALESKGRIFACGNGGSMADAMHFTEELAGRSRRNRPPLPALAFSDPATLSCIANDYGYDAVFSRQVEAQAQRGDLVVPSLNKRQLAERDRSRKNRSCTRRHNCWPTGTRRRQASIRSLTSDSRPAC